MKAEGSEILNCYTQIDTATDCRISRCRINLKKATNCKISECWVDVEDSMDCEIFDCSSGFWIVKNAKNSSSIGRCFAKHNIAYKCTDSQIYNCAIGHSEKSYSFKRICEELSRTSKLENNVAIDSITVDGKKYEGKSDPNGKDGETISAAMFNQRLFEFTLGWDFENVWEWDDANNQPALRCFSNPETASKPAAAPPNTTGMEDLLLQQIRNNIWL